MSIRSLDPRADYYVLGAASVISKIVAAQPKGEFGIPVSRKLSLETSAFGNAQDMSAYLRHVLQSSHLKKRLGKQAYMEINSELLTMLHKDWMLSPQMRYVTPELLSSAILVDNHQILLINWLEVYGRLNSIDAHHERHWRSASLPRDGDDRYNGLTVATDVYDNSTKLWCTKFITDNFGDLFQF